MSRCHDMADECGPNTKKGRREASPASYIIKGSEKFVPNDIVRYDVYSSELDRRKFRYALLADFPHGFSRILQTYPNQIGAIISVPAFIGRIASSQSRKVVNQCAKFVRRVGLFGDGVFFSGFSGMAFSSWSIR